MFAYCENDPVGYGDAAGHARIQGADCGGGLAYAGALPKTGGIKGLVRLAIRIHNIYNKTYSCANTIRSFTESRSNIPYESCHGNSVYIMRAGEDVVYVGRTNDPYRRQAEHARDSTKDGLSPLEVKYTGLTEMEARVMEQILISSYYLQKDGGVLFNRRNEIALRNVPNYLDALFEVARYFPEMTGWDVLGLIEG